MPSQWKSDGLFRHVFGEAFSAHWKRVGVYRVAGGTFTGYSLILGFNGIIQCNENGRRHFSWLYIF